MYHFMHALLPIHILKMEVLKLWIKKIKQREKHIRWTFQNYKCNVNVTNYNVSLRAAKFYLTETRPLLSLAIAAWCFHANPVEIVKI